jgi:hypothetical protein
MQDQNSTSGCEALPDDNPKEAKKEISEAVHYHLHLLQKSKYVTDQKTLLHHAQRKQGSELKIKKKINMIQNFNWCRDKA